MLFSFAILLQCLGSADSKGVHDLRRRGARLERAARAGDRAVELRVARNLDAAMSTGHVISVPVSGCT